MVPRAKSKGSRTYLKFKGKEQVLLEGKKGKDGFLEAMEFCTRP